MDISAGLFCDHFLVILQADIQALSVASSLDRRALRHSSTILEQPARAFIFNAVIERAWLLRWPAHADVVLVIANVWLREAAQGMPPLQSPKKFPGQV